MKKVYFALAFVVIAFVGGIGFILSNLDEYVKEIVEAVGSEVTNVSVTLEDANIDPANGLASLTGLQVGNPAGFETEYAMSLGSISVKMDPTTVTGDVITIEEITIDAPAVIYEIGNNGSNIDAIQANVEAYVNGLTEGGDAESANAGSSEPQEEASASSSQEPKFIINHVYIRSTAASVSASVLGGKTMTVNVPDIHLTDIGKDSGGDTASEAATQILDSWMNDINAAVGGANIEGLEDMATGMLESIEVPAGAEEAVGGAVKEASSVINNLFGNSN